MSSFAGQSVDSGVIKPFFSDLWRFDIRTETWTKVQCNGLLLQPRAAHTSTVIGDNMFVFGGVIREPGKQENKFTDQAFVLNFQGISSSTFPRRTANIEKRCIFRSHLEKLGDVWSQPWSYPERRAFNARLTARPCMRAIDHKAMHSFC